MVNVLLLQPCIKNYEKQRLNKNITSNQRKITESERSLKVV